MPIIVFGGCGYLGSRIVKFLLPHNKVICVDNLINSFTGVFDEGPVLENLSFVTDPDAFEPTEPERINAIIVCAGPLGETKSPDDTYQAHAAVLFKALEVMKNTGCEKFIYISTSEVYGTEGIKTEIDLTTPSTPYAQAHVHNEKILQDMARAYPGKQITVLRVTQVYDNVVPKLLPKEWFGPAAKILRAIKLGLPYGIKGGQYETSDRSEPIDWIHVKDFLSLMGKLLIAELVGYRVYNVGNGKPITMLRLLNMYKNTYPGLTIEVDSSLTQPCTFLNIEKVVRELRWTPSVIF